MAIGPTFEKGHVTGDDVLHHYERARKAAAAVVERLARLTMQDNNNYIEFFMAYGNWGFYRVDGKVVSGVYCPSAALLDFIETWDKTLRLSYIKMRFTANGPIVREW